MTKPKITIWGPPCPIEPLGMALRSLRIAGYAILFGGENTPPEKANLVLAPSEEALDVYNASIDAPPRPRGTVWAEYILSSGWTEKAMLAAIENALRPRFWYAGKGDPCKIGDRYVYLITDARKEPTTGTMRALACNEQGYYYELIWRCDASGRVDWRAADDWATLWEPGGDARCLG